MKEMILVIQASFQQLSFARNVVSLFVVDMHPTIDDITEIKTIIGEAVSNAIIHGYNEDQVSKIIIQANIEDDTMIVSVKDEGVGIENIDEARKPMFSTKKNIEHAGMGFSIIEALCDEVKVISSLNQGTQLIMKKRMHHV